MEDGQPLEVNTLESDRVGRIKRNGMLFWRPKTCQKSWASAHGRSGKDARPNDPALDEREGERATPMMMGDVPKENGMVLKAKASLEALAETQVARATTWRKGVTPLGRGKIREASG